MAGWAIGSEDASDDGYIDNMKLKDILRNHWEKLAILLVLIIAGSLIMEYYYIPDHTMQSAYFREYPAKVFLEVEEPLPPETVRLLAMLAFESLNETFGFSISLAGVTTFPDDGLWNYSDEILNETLWGASQGGSRSLRCSVKDGSMRLLIRAFTGQGPHKEYYEDDGRAAGISNYGDTIGIFFKNPTSDLIYLNPVPHIKTFLHEFGHAFGLEHNVTSAMMYSPEVNLNGTDEPYVSLPFSVKVDSGVIYPFPDGTFEAAWNECNISEISTNPIYYRFDGPEVYFNFSTPQYWAPESPNCTGFLNQSHLLCLKGDYHDDLAIIRLERSLVDTELGYYWHHYTLEWCTFNLSGYEAFWTDYEILTCKG